MKIATFNYYAAITLIIFATCSSVTLFFRDLILTNKVDYAWLILFFAWFLLTQLNNLAGDMYMEQERH
jgi:hypothetical protein